MATPVSLDVIAAEFDMLMSRAGIDVPPERRAGILSAYTDFRSQLHLLHGPRTHLAEPSNIFALAAKESA